MLTLLLVLGAVTCSPVPSDFPAFPDASAHVEVTHEVRQVTYEVSAEVNEATASSHIPSDVAPEEDPPIPTVTTPHTAPDEQHSHDATTEIGLAAEPNASEISGEASSEHEIASVRSLHEETHSHEEKTKIKSDEQSEESLEKKVSETENTSESEKAQEAIIRSSPETLELVPESHIYLVGEDTNISHSTVFPAKIEETATSTPVKVVSEVIGSVDYIPEETLADHIAEESLLLADEEVESPSVSHTDDTHKHLEESVKTEHGNEEVPEILSHLAHEGDGVEFLETEKRTDNEDLPAHEESSPEPVSETPQEELGIVAPNEHVPETTRESRVYIEYEDEESIESEEGKKEQAFHEEEKSHLEAEDKPANNGLQSMSMTSPTPESLSEDVPIVGDLEKEEAPPAENQEIEDVTVLPEVESQEENSTLIADVEEPIVVPDVFVNPPSSSVAPLPVEEYTDNYGDPLNFGDLPDFDVTHEHLPSKDHPLPKDAQLVPKQTHDHTGDVSKEESSDLAAGDHMLEVEAGTPRVLPPQQEQVSAAAPSSLTPGCIVAIVFGVLVSLVVILGVGGFMIWQRRTQNRPKVLGNDQGYAGSDSGGYIDDQVRVSYVNSQTDTPKGSPEDLISLDNDSFLNSLESMTIQNLWTDNIRHTKL